MFNLKNLISKIPTVKNLNAKIFLIPLSLFSKIFCHFWGVSFQTEILIMNFLGAVSSFIS